MRIAIIGDSKRSGGGNQNWAVEFANIMKEFGIKCDYIGDSNFPRENRLYDMATQSSIQPDNFFKFLKTPADVISKMSSAQKRLYEQFSKKIYDAYIIQRVDFLPIVQSFNLTKKVPIYIPTHDISMFENIVFDTNATTETPYRMIEMNEHFLKSNVSILATSTFLQNQLQDFNPKLTVEMLPIPLNDAIRDASRTSFKKTNGVLWVGSQTSYKNPDMMFDIVKQMPDTKFTMVFNTKDAGTFTKITKKYKADNLTVLPSQTLPNLITLYSEHRLGIITSTVETFCIVAQEQLCFHPTLVSTKSCNQYHNIFNDLIPFDNVRDAVAKIKEIYNDEAIYNATRDVKDSIVDVYAKDKVKEAYKEFALKLKADLETKNTSKGDLNTLGGIVRNLLNIEGEVNYEDVLNAAKYADWSMAQLSILSQLRHFKRKEYKDRTAFVKG